MAKTKKKTKKEINVSGYILIDINCSVDNRDKVWFYPTEKLLQEQLRELSNEYFNSNNDSPVDTDDLMVEVYQIVEENTLAQPIKFHIDSRPEFLFQKAK